MNTQNPDILDPSYIEGFAQTPEELQDFCEVFFRVTEKALENLARAAQSADHKLWVEEAHQIKGSAGMMGATALHALCAAAQAMPPSGAQTYAAEYARIQNAYAQLKTLLQEKIKNFNKIK